MPRPKLTERTVASLPAPDPGGRQVLHWDAELRGFGVLCSGKTNARTYVVQKDINGRSRRVTIGPANVLSLDVARRRARDLLAAMHLGQDPKAERRGAATLRGVLADYLAARKALRPKTAGDYRAVVERWLAPWLDVPLRSITPDMVEARHRAIQAEVERGGRYSGAATANGAMVALRLLWNFAAERDDTYTANPVRRLRRAWYPVARRERLVRADELPAFYAAVAALPNPVARDYLLLLLFTGLRRREAARLTWADIDFAAGMIRVPAASTKAGRKLDLPMTDLVRDLLVARRAPGVEEFVFPADSQSGHIEEPKFALKLVAQESGITVSAHDLRRTFVTVAEGVNISPLALRALVNHSLGSGVTEGYVQMSVDRLREPAQRVADRLRELCGIAPAGDART